MTDTKTRWTQLARILQVRAARELPNKMTGCAVSAEQQAQDLFTEMAALAGEVTLLFCYGEWDSPKVLRGNLADPQAEIIKAAVAWVTAPRSWREEYHREVLLEEALRGGSTTVLAGKIIDDTKTTRPTPTTTEGLPIPEGLFEGERA
jgi:hypothetical protein